MVLSINPEGRFMDSSPQTTTAAHLAALNNLYDLVSEHIAENPGADPELQSMFSEALERCQNAAELAPDISAGLGEDVRNALISHAREFVGDDLGIDDSAMLSVADDAVWVQCWCRFTNDEMAGSDFPILAAFATER
jgi:hypothetical protein